MDKKAIETDKAPKAIGPYSQAVKYGDMLFCSGQIGMDPESGELVSGGIEAQTEQIFKNVQAVLNKAGMDFKNILKATIYITSMYDFASVNNVYSKYFTTPFPARAAVEVSGLPKDALIEMEVIAGS